MGLHWPETYVLPDVDVLFHVLQQCGELLEGLGQTDAVLPASVGHRFKRLGAPRFLQRYAALHTQPTAITGASFHQTRNYATLYTQRTATMSALIMLPCTHSDQPQRALRFTRNIIILPCTQRTATMGASFYKTHNYITLYTQ